jgi:hypothetical protein
MLLDIKIAANPKAFELGAKSVDQAIAEANDELKREAKKHFGAGQISIGRLSDGRFFFRHIVLGTMVRVPDEFSLAAARDLARSAIPGVRILPIDPVPAVDGFHGIWAKQSFVDSLVAREQAAA